MADAATTTAPATTSSTPAEPVVTAAAVKAADPTPKATETSTAQVTESPKPADAPPAKQEAKPTAEQPADALFTLPDDMKLAPEASTKFETALRAKLQADGKSVLLTPQEVTDLFVEQARDAYTRWQQQVVDTDKANEATCKARFTPAQLTESETAVGFIASYDPQFREFAKSQLNNPIFVNAMRLIGERLSEDAFEVAGSQPSKQPGKTAAERMGYVKAKAN